MGYREPGARHPVPLAFLHHCPAAVSEPNGPIASLRLAIAMTCDFWLRHVRELSLDEGGADPHTGAGFPGGRFHARTGSVGATGFETRSGELRKNHRARYAGVPRSCGHRIGKLGVGVIFLRLPEIGAKVRPASHGSGHQPGGDCAATTSLPNAVANRASNGRRIVRAPSSEGNGHQHGDHLHHAHYRQCQNRWAWSSGVLD